MRGLRERLSIGLLVLALAACFVDNGTSSASNAAGGTTTSSGTTTATTSAPSTTTTSSTSTGEASTSPTSTGQPDASTGELSTSTTSPPDATTTGDPGTTTGIPCDGNEDCPASENECVVFVCFAGECVDKPVAAGKMCNLLADQCDGMGHCVDCVDNGGCTECCVCTNNMCIPA